MNFHLTRLAPVLLIIRITGSNGHSLRVSFFVPPKKRVLGDRVWIYGILTKLYPFVIINNAILTEYKPF